MALIIPLIIAGIVVIVLIMMIPSLVMHTIGQLLMSRPDDYEGWCYYSTLLERTGHYFQAYNAYNKSIVINPEYYEAQNRRDNLIMKMENYSGTTDSFYHLDTDP